MKRRRTTEASLCLMLLRENRSAVCTMEVGSNVALRGRNSLSLTPSPVLARWARETNRDASASVQRPKCKYVFCVLRKL